jgi:low affinity Fe/Cu permease
LPGLKIKASSEMVRLFFVDFLIIEWYVVIDAKNFRGKAKMNLKLNEKIVYDKRGRKKDVIIAYPEYRKLMELVENLDDIQGMKEVEKEDTVPWEHVKMRLGRQGKA